jgi:hypothetical protein
MRNAEGRGRNASGKLYLVVVRLVDISSDGTDRHLRFQFLWWSKSTFSLVDEPREAGRQIFEMHRAIPKGADLIIHPGVPDPAAKNHFSIRIDAAGTSEQLDARLLGNTSDFDKWEITITP